MQNPPSSIASKELRYYQRLAVQRTLEHIAAGQRRLLLVMATGTGKTLTASQILWQLRRSGRVKRALFLVDRNILADQTKNNDFKIFGDVVTKVANRTLEPSYEVYIALYQSLTGPDESDKIYRNLSPSFFDLIIIDECHRGSAKDDSAWREILEHFSSAIQLGLTATPKETSDVSTQTYFGEPIYEYSLKQGIEDGYLAPYKVIRIDLDTDLEGWRPGPGLLDVENKPIEDRVYHQRDMDTNIILTARATLIAERVVRYMKETDPYGKTIVFCEDIKHAERMRSALVNEVARQLPHEAANTDRFVARITGDDARLQEPLDDFMHPERRYPVIATTSKLLTTGVDVQTCKLIVLEQKIESRIEFKQILGRGTRVHEDSGKFWFTVLDFKNATKHFDDPDFNGDPVIIYEPRAQDPLSPPEPDPTPDPTPDTTPQPKTPRNPQDPQTVSAAAVSIVAEHTSYYDPNTAALAASPAALARAKVLQRFPSHADLLQRWLAAPSKPSVLAELRECGVLFEALQNAFGADLDDFDLVCHVAYDLPPMTRRARADALKAHDALQNYPQPARDVLYALLDTYVAEGLALLEDPKLLRLAPYPTWGTPLQIIGLFGGRDKYLGAVQTLAAALYRAPA